MIPGFENGKVENASSVVKNEEEQNGDHCDVAPRNGARSPVQNGAAEERKQDDAPSSAVEQKPQNEEDVSRVLSNVLDEVENNIVTNVVSRDTAPVQEVPEETMTFDSDDENEVIEEVVIKVGNKAFQV